MKLGAGLRLILVVLAIGLGAPVRASAPETDRLDPWFVDVLRALHEPLLQNNRDKTAQVYRLVALPTFDHPTSVRITVWSDGVVAATMRSSSGWGGYDFGQLDRERAIVVSPDDLQALKKAMSEIDFWTLPTSAPPVRIEHPDGMVEQITCTDGTTIIVEAVADGRHHLVHRHCVQREDLRPVVDVFERIARRRLMPGPMGK